MNGRELITASMRELERVKVIEAVVEGRPRCFQAAERLQLGERQISRLCRRYEAASKPSGVQDDRLDGRTKPTQEMSAMIDTKSLVPIITDIVDGSN